MKQIKFQNGWLWLILALGFTLRLWGIGFGLPHLYHADEPIVVNHAMAYGTGDLNPHFFKIPPLASYILFFCYGIYFLIGRTAGWFANSEEFAGLFLTDPTPFYLIGRVILGALMGTATIYLVYRLIAKHFSKAHGLLASFFLAVTFLHIRDSHYIYADIPLLLVLVAGFFPIFRILEREKWMDYLSFGFLAGVAVATKYNGAFIYPSFLLAHFLRTHSAATRDTVLQKSRSPMEPTWQQLGQSLILRRPLRMLCVLAITMWLSLVTFGLLNPFSWLDANFFIKELLTQGGSMGAAGFFHHLRCSLWGGLGFSLCLFSLAGFFCSFTRFEPKRMIFASFVLVYYFLLAVFSQPYDRYVLPLVPFLVFFAADFLLAVSRRMGFKSLGVFSLALVIASPSLTKAMLSDRLFSRKDTRTIACEWVETNLPTGSKIALDIPFYMPRLRPTLSQLREKQVLVRQEGGSSAQALRFKILLEDTAPRPDQIRFELYFLKDGPEEENFIFSRPTLPYDFEVLKESGVEYVIMVRTHKEKLNQEFYAKLREVGELVGHFTPYQNSAVSRGIDPQPLTGGPFLWKDLILRNRNGQILEIYKL